MHSPISNRSRVAKLVACMVLTIGTHAAASPYYKVTDLGKIHLFLGQGLNDAGQVAGWGETTNGAIFGVVYDSYGPNAGRVADTGGYGSFSSAVNNSGQVVGTRQGAGGYHAYLASGDRLTDLGALPGDDRSHAYAINDSGQVVGESMGRGRTRAFLSSDGRMTDLGNLPGGLFSGARDINNAGQVAGQTYFSSGSIGVPGWSRAFLYENGAMRDLGDLGGKNTFANAINDAGQVVGYSVNDIGNHHAYIYTDGGMYDLGTLGGVYSQATGINNLGQVVGESTMPWDPYWSSHIFLYSDGVMTDISAMLRPGHGWSRMSPTAINDLGQIVGNGFGPDGSYHAFLLTPPGQPTPATPLFPNVTPVPEPASWAVFALASVFTLGRFRRRATGVVTGHSPGRDARD